MAFIFTNYIDVTPAYTSSWQDMNLSAHIPANASGVCIFVQGDSFGSMSIGLRKKGSTDNRTQSLAAQGQTYFYAGVDSNRMCQGYVGSTAFGVKFWLAGYFTDWDGVFFTNGIDKSLATTGSWQTVDCSADVPAGAKALVFEVWGYGSFFKWGLRCNGSSDDRKTYSNHTFAVVPCDADRKVQGWIENALVDWWLVGYIKEGQFFTNGVDKSLTQTYQWVDIDMTGQSPPNGVCGVLVEVFHGSGSTYCALRRKGSTDDFYGTRYMGHDWGMIGIDANNVWQGQTNNLNLDYFVLGFFIDPSQAIPQETGSVVVAAQVESVDNWEVSEVVAQAGISGDQGEDGSMVGQASISSEMEENGALVAQASILSELGEEGLIIGQGVISSELSQEGSVVAVGVISVDEYREEPRVTGVGVIIGDWGEEPVVAGVGVIGAVDMQSYLVTGSLVARAILRGGIGFKTAPTVTWMDPAPDQTGVAVNYPVKFTLRCRNNDAVNVSSIVVTVNGTPYTVASPQFKYTGYNGNQIVTVEVWAGTFSLEQMVSVSIQASSQMGAVMATKSYSYQITWDSTKTRLGKARIELFKPPDYDWNILTIQEDWVRKGVERYSPELEVWFGRFMHLPNILNMKFKAVAGSTNAEGKEILDNGWLSVKFGSGSWTPLYPSTEINLGPMFSHEKKNFFLKLLVPEMAQTVKYAMLQLVFTPETAFLYGLYQYGKELYLGTEDLIGLHPNIFVYRAYLMDAEMWNKWLTLGFTPGGPWRPDDKQW